MVAIMCVDDYFNSDSEDNEALDENYKKRSVMEVIETELSDAKEKGNDTVKWLELEELDIDDDTLFSLDIASKFRVRLYQKYS